MKRCDTKAYVDSMSEKELLDTIRQAASLYHWECYHTHDSRRSEPGFPDLVLAGHGQLMFLECKSAGGKIHVEQRAWLAALSRVQELPYVAIVRPANLDSILDRLKQT